MNDPFDALRITDTPLDPRPESAAALRSGSPHNWRTT